VTTTPLREQTSVDEYVAPRERARASRISATVAGWIAITVLIAFVVELTCRVEDWVTYRAPLLSRYTSINDLMTHDADGMHGRPNARYLKWEMNALGTRGPSATPTPATGTVRIITVGASETFGLRESPGREYPRQLQDSLNADLKRGACGAQAPAAFEVLNAGFAGMGLPTIEQDLRLRVRKFVPTAIIVYPTPAQYLQDDVPFAPRPDSGARSVEPSLIHALRPRTIERVRDQIKQVLPEWVKTRLRAYQTREMLRNSPANWRFTSVPADRLAAYERDLRIVIGTIHSIGAVPVLATHGNLFMGRQTLDHDAIVAWEKFYPRATGQTIMDFDAAARMTTLRVGLDSGVTTIDAAKVLAAAPTAAFGDFVHFTDLGASYMAEAVGAGVLSAVRTAGVCGAPTATTSTADENPVRR
jgi:hypothetical protein